MKKFNNFENWFIVQSLTNAIEEAEADVAEAKRSGKRLIYAPGYFEMVGQEIIDHVDALTLKGQTSKSARRSQTAK